MPQNEKFNTIMEESTGNTLCMLIDKPISADGYEQSFMPRVKAILSEYESISLLIYYKEFKGWEDQAAAMDMSATAQYGHKVGKLALVNAPKKEILQKKLKEPLFKSDVRFFAENDLGKALDWVKEESA